MREYARAGDANAPPRFTFHDAHLCDAIISTQSFLKSLNTLNVARFTRPRRTSFSNFPFRTVLTAFREIPSILPREYLLKVSPRRDCSSACKNDFRVIFVESELNRLHVLLVPQFHNAD